MALHARSPRSPWHSGLSPRERMAALRAARRRAGRCQTCDTPALITRLAWEGKVRRSWRMTLCYPCLVRSRGPTDVDPTSKPGINGCSESIEVKGAAAGVSVLSQLRNFTNPDGTVWWKKRQ